MPIRSRRSCSACRKTAGNPPILGRANKMRTAGMGGRPAAVVVSVGSKTVGFAGCRIVVRSRQKPPLDNELDIYLARLRRSGEDTCFGPYEVHTLRLQNPSTTKSRSPPPLGSRCITLPSPSFLPLPPYPHGPPAPGIRTPKLIPCVHCRYRSYLSTTHTIGLALVVVPVQSLLAL